VKILDRYILTSFLTTFTTVFVILFFIFILQGIWLFIADLAGKDLDTFLIIKFLLFYAPKIVPLVLPLSVLLASIMTFGNFAENYEFAAMKSSGISLGRAMQSLIVFIILLSITAFFFANNIIPKAEYEFVNLRKTIVQQKPSMAITEGQFNKVGDYNIKVDKKYGDNGNLLDNVTIHKISKLGTGVSTVIKSDRGELMSSEKSNFLQMVLFDGYYYENLETRNPNDRNKQLFAKSSFKKYIINFDLAPLENMDTDEDKIANTNTMLNIHELRYTLDSLEKNRKKEVLSFTDNIHQKQTVVNSPVKKETAPRVKDTLKKDILSFLTDQEKAAVFELAKSNITNTKYSIEGSRSEFEGKSKNINNHWLALYEKFVIAYGCLLMFFIGAPLGAIIRKGGLGLPIVFAMLIFIIFHFINVFGKKIAQEDGLPPFMGAWMSSFVLTPLALLLTYRATNDIGLINMDNFLQPIYKYISKVFVSTKNKEE
jgi:lipopolysaccharide export system permease protein